MKINFIVPEIAISGGMRLIFEISNRLIEKGHKVTLYTPIIPFNPYRGIYNLFYFKYRLKYVVKYFLGKVKPPENIFKKLFEIKYIPLIKNAFLPDADIVVATSWTTASYVDKLSMKKGKKFYLVQDYEQWKSNVKFVDESYKLPLKKIVISTYLQNLLKDKFGVDSEKILIGINTGMFYNNEKMFNHEKRILFMDHELKNKNVEGAVETVKKLKERYPELKFSAFGTAKHHSIPDFVEFHENLTDEGVRQIYSKSDIFIFPSLYEGFGGPPAEAMACKCAVVGNAVAAFPEYAVNKRSAILCNPRKPEELFEGVRYLLENEDELKRISIEGNYYVTKVLDWNTAIDNFEKCFLNGYYE